MPVDLEARDTGKECAGDDVARVVREVGDVGRSGVDRARGPHGLAQDLQLNGGRILPSGPVPTGR